MSFLLLLLILPVCFIIILIINAVVAVQRLKNRARDMFNRATGQSTRQNGRNSSGNNRYQSPPQRKKIDPGIGEYVEFEEIEVLESTQADGPTVSYRTESQITDVEWEEIR